MTQPDPCGASFEPAEGAAAKTAVTDRCHQDEHGECNWRGCPAEDTELCPLAYTGDEPWWDAGNA